MKISLFMLILLSACLHVYWNVLIKRSKERLCFLWWMYIVSFLLLPFVIFFMKAGRISLIVWLIVCLSGLVHFLYTIILSYAYEEGDLSLVYPLARSAPLFVLMGSVLFLKETPSFLGFLGIILTLIGAYTIGFESLKINQLLRPLAMLRKAPYQLALLTAMITAAYSIIDRIGVSLIDPFYFIVLLLFVETIFYTPFVLWKKKKYLLQEWYENKKTIVVAGLVRFISYLLILYVMLQTQLSYIVSVRQTSIVLAVISGSLLLEEKHLKVRLVGSASILAGVLLIGAKG